MKAPHKQELFLPSSRNGDGLLRKEIMLERDGNPS